MTFSFSPVFVFWSPVLYDFEYVNYTVIGIAWILMRVAMLIGNMVLEKWINTTFLTLSIVSVTCGLCIIGLAFLKQLWMLFTGILIFEFLLGLIYPLKETVLNVQSENTNRATIFSIEMTWIQL